MNEKIMLIGIITKEKCIIAGPKEEYMDIVEANDLSIFDYTKVELRVQNNDLWENPRTWTYSDNVFHHEWFSSEIDKYKEKFYQAAEKWWSKYVLYRQKIESLDEGEYYVKDCEIKQLAGNVQIKTCENTIIHSMKHQSMIDEFCGSSIIYDMCDNSSILNAKDAITIKYMHDQSSINKLMNRGLVEKMYGQSHIQCMYDHTVIEDVLQEASIDTMCDYAFIDEISGNAYIGNMVDHASINKMLDNTEVKTMSYYSRINLMQDNSRVNIMGGKSIITEMIDRSKVYSMEGISFVGNIGQGSSIVEMKNGTLARCYDKDAKIVVPIKANLSIEEIQNIKQINEREIIDDIKKNGYRITDNLLANIKKLAERVGKVPKIEEIKNTYKSKNNDENTKDIVNDIAKELKLQDRLNQYQLE